jgi:UDP-N-acetylglucosamine--N-acetylmuramyl-(pentapeptide) pyrophosphoryl-undecaprenol N-acetylglucosamine transferase
MSSPPKRHLTILLAGGGTGGHIFPLLAVAESIRAQRPDAQCRFICSTRPLDAEILSREGMAFDAIPARPFGARPSTLARFVLGWGAALRSARTALRAHNTDIVITSGGFVAAPVAQAARREGIPIIAVNLDAVAGKANRWIARLARVRLSTTDAETDEVPKSWQRIAPIVRRAMRTPRNSSDARRALGLAPDKATLLVTGGSQGARTINDALAQIVSTHAGSLAGWQVLHQCGGDTGEAQRLRGAYADARVAAVVVPFIEDMGNAWWAADLALARSGAGAVAEVRATCVPTIFMPYPYHRDNHQRVNALALERVHGVVIVEDAIDADRNAAALNPVLLHLLADEAARAEMRGNLKALGPADGADRVADAALRLISG